MLSKKSDVAETVKTDWLLMVERQQGEPASMSKDAEEEDEEVQQQCKGLHVPPAEEEGRGKRRVQAPIRLTFDAPGKPPKSALAGVALMVGDDEESDHEECALRSSPVEMPGEPATLKEALESSDAEDWKKAMESELKSIEENGTWELVELPEGRKAITSKWLFKINSDPNGKIERYNSRNIAKGYLQNEKVEFKALFAHLLKPTMLRTLLARAAIKGWVVKRMDVKTAFLNHILEEEIFMAQLEGCWAGQVAQSQLLLLRLLWRFCNGTCPCCCSCGSASALSADATGTPALPSPSAVVTPLLSPAMSLTVPAAAGGTPALPSPGVVVATPLLSPALTATPPAAALVTPPLLSPAAAASAPATAVVTPPLLSPAVL
ncbi:unnamed protein product [Closterium sp. NIES-54]